MFVGEGYYALINRTTSATNAKERNVFKILVFQSL